MAPPPGPPAAGPATGPVIAVFDVDRTLLRGDCLHLAVRRSQGPLGLLAGGLALAPSLVAWWLRRLSTGALKENALALFHVCDAVNQAEAAGRGDWLLPALIRDLRPAALARLREHQRRGDRVVLCSASPRMLLQPLAHWLGVELLATELRVQEGRWLPVLAGPNCKGPEKVRRLQAHLGGMEGLVLEAYGDSRGDWELLRAADRPHYRSFQAEPHPYPETAVPPRPSPTIRSCFVLGSTSVVAQAICRELALRGCGRVHLIARDGLRNAEVAEALRELSGAAVSTEHTDLCDDASLQEVRRPRVGEFDLYLITAGWLGDAERARMDPEEALRITAANYSGLVPWLTAIA
ncbi:MAG: HAD-IB family phosphatase, partial [Cyanobacteriota bacterium]